MKTTQANTVKKPVIRSFLNTTFFTALMLFPFSAHAQSVNYSTMSDIFGEPVTTSANGSPQRESEVPVNMEILTAEDIEQSGARTLPEVLRFVPGVDVRRYTFGHYEVSFRGYN